MHTKVLHYSGEHSKQPWDDASNYNIEEDKQKESMHLPSYKVTLERENDVKPG